MPSSSPTIRAEALSKRFLGDRPPTLEGITFSIQKGQALGLVGSNGAGKSTLIRILSRSLKPSSGRVYLEGRVGAVVDLGIGFHPDMTGKENLYLQGAALGMRTAQIRAKYDAIVDFAELGEVIDRPAREYSTGMGMKLGLSLTLHQECDILLLDEALAASDASFTGKYLRRLREMITQGATIIWASHDLESTAKLCDKVLLLESGRGRVFDSPREAIGYHLSKSRRSGVLAHVKKL